MGPDFPSDPINVDVRSEACEDLGRGHGCGQASLWVNARDYSRKGRGYNFVVINAYNGKLQYLANSFLAGVINNCKKWFRTLFSKNCRPKLRVFRLRFFLPLLYL